MSYRATYSPDDNKLRLYAANRLDPETYARVKAAGFSWAPKQELFVAPMWTPAREDLLLELAGEIEDEDKTLVERAEERAERFDDYADKRGREAEGVSASVRQLADSIPFGQPILVGHHSERRARKDAEKIRAGMDRSIRLFKTSAYWTDRAAGAIHAAKYKERPAVRARRIKGLESDERKYTKVRDGLTKALALWQTLDDDAKAVVRRKDGESTTFLERALVVTNYEPYGGSSIVLDDGRKYTAWGALKDELITPEKVREQRLAELPRLIDVAERWLEHLANRLAYERAMLAEGGGLITDRAELAVGGRVLVGREWLVILRLNKVGDKVTSVTTTRRFSKVVGVESIQDYAPPDPEETAKVIEASKLPPMTNYPEGAHHMTKAEWAKLYRDYKGSRVVLATETHGTHRRRTAVVRGGLSPIFLTDEKQKDPPPPGDATPPPMPERRIEPRVTPTLDERRAKRDAAIEQAKKIEAIGPVQVVSAPELFPTPEAIATAMAMSLDVQEGDRVLEPSAGTGRLVDAVLALGIPCQMVMAEVNPKLSVALSVKNVGHVQHGDFLEMVASDLGGRVDRILMNPPFGKGADIAHIMHALELLKPGGRLVALAANGPRQQDALRPLAEANGGRWIPAAEGAFASEGTNVRVVCMVINKPAEEARMVS